MAITQISVVNETNVKLLKGATTDKVSTFPVDCAKGSRIDIYDSTNYAISYLFDGINWDVINEQVELKDLFKINHISTDADDKYTLNMEYKSNRLFEISALYDIPQVETAVVVGTITGDGNATFTVTAAGMTNSPIAFTVPVLTDDTAAEVAAKAKVIMDKDARLTSLYTVGVTDANLTLTRIVPTANDATLNIAYTNDTCTGLTPDASSNNTTASGIAAKTLVVDNLPTESTFKVILDNIAGVTLTFFTTIVWEGGSEPTLTAGKKYIMEFTSIDGGTTFYGTASSAI